MKKNKLIKKNSTESIVLFYLEIFFSDWKNENVSKQ